MADPELVEAFNRCLKYKQAKSWQKPLRNPARFLANQMRKYALSRSRGGALGQTSAFHLPAFTIVTGEGVSEIIRAYGIYEEELTEAFLRLVEPGQLVVDIGMHLGYYSTLFACLVGPTGEVHAFEPTPRTREIAQQNIRQFPNVKLHPDAVWSSKDKLTFYDYGFEWMGFNSFTTDRIGAAASNAKPFEVQTTTLDIFRQTLAKPISLVKIDAENAELEILRAGQQMLEQDQPIVTLEVGDPENKPGYSSDLISAMQRINYVPWEFKEKRFVPHAIRSTYEYDNLIFAPTSEKLFAR